MAEESRNRTLNDGLKQRVVGALVLVVLGVIFLPMILDFKGDRQIDKTTRIPTAPDIQPVVMALPIKPVGIPVPKSSQDVYQLEESTDKVASLEPEQTAATKPVTSNSKKLKILDDKGLPLTWVIKVVSYADQSKANGLSSDIKSSGLKSFVRSAKVSGKTYYRVFVGPFVEKTRATNTQKTINKQYKVQSALLKFEP
jgi:DedD protein